MITTIEITDEDREKINDLCKEYDQPSMSSMLRALVRWAWRDLQKPQTVGVKDDKKEK